MKQRLEEQLHATSISLAILYHELRNSNDDQQDKMDNLMLAYQATRRAMDKSHAGKTYNSHEAYEAMSLGEFPDASPPTNRPRGRDQWDEIDAIATQLDLG